MNPSIDQQTLLTTKKTYNFVVVFGDQRYNYHVKTIKLSYHDEHPYSIHAEGFYKIKNSDKKLIKKTIEEYFT